QCWHGLMLTTFRIPRVLQTRCSGRAELRLPGGTVGELLAALAREAPDLYGCICDETGTIRRHINLFVNDDFLRDRNGVETRLEPGDVVSVFQAVSGG
ncbi:MAG TPA: MoaD/ThiS family protein, partial [Pirellulaceae bacterium]|nr:MoaD/ThiS family protein [Pirellulaceae bacterium]